jgi:hypothetical protein
LDYVFRNTSKQNKLRDALGIWIKENISIVLDRLDVTEENVVNAEVADFVSGKFKLIKDL